VPALDVRAGPAYIGRMWGPEPRESDRYPKATLRQQVEDFIGWFPAHRNGTTAIVLVVGLLILWRLLTSSPVRLEDLRTGDCLFVRTTAATAVVDPGPGDPASVRQAVLAGGAEHASCDLSHSHEVTGMVDLAGEGAAPGAPPAYDPPVLLAAAEDACAPTLATYVGLAPGAASTAYTGFAVIPDARSWERGGRTAACLLASADGRFLAGPAHGTGR
jgi:hypothetical protein